MARLANTLIPTSHGVWSNNEGVGPHLDRKCCHGNRVET